MDLSARETAMLVASFRDEEGSGRVVFERVAKDLEITQKEAEDLYCLLAKRGLLDALGWAHGGDDNGKLVCMTTPFGREEARRLIAEEQKAAHLPGAGKSQPKPQAEGRGWERMSVLLQELNPFLVWLYQQVGGSLDKHADAMMYRDVKPNLSEADIIELQRRLASKNLIAFPPVLKYYAGAGSSANEITRERQNRTLLTPEGRDTAEQLLAKPRRPVNELVKACWFPFNAFVSHPVISGLIVLILGGFLAIGMYTRWGFNVTDPSTSHYHELHTPASTQAATTQSGASAARGSG